MNFQQRFCQGACTYVQLEDAEKTVYQGSGECLVAVEHGFVMAMLYLDDEIVFDTVDVQKVADNALDACKNFISKHKEVWFCRASAHQLCDPQPASDPDVLAQLARIIGEKAADI